MREQREPWLKLPERDPGGEADRRVDPRFRTHIVTTHGGRAAAADDSQAMASGRSQNQPLPQPMSFGSVLPFRPAGPTPQKPIAIAHATEPAPPAPPAPSPQIPATPLVSRNVGSDPTSSAPRPAPSKRTGAKARGAPPLGINDLLAVSSADWATKVGEAAKMVDVVVVFYTAGYLGSDMFEFAFQTVVNEVLPQSRRPYALYRFSLDAEPSFVAEMTESLGLPQDNPVTVAGFAWSGPGRRLLLIGDRALRSRAAFSRFLRRSLMDQQQAPPYRESVTRDRSPLSFERQRRAYERERRPRPRLIGGRALAVLAWCLLGTAALGAVVVGVEPQWARALLQLAALPQAGGTQTDPRPAADAQAVNAAAASLDNRAGGSTGDQAQAPTTVKPAKSAHVRKTRTPSRLTSNPAYWGLPEERPR